MVKLNKMHLYTINSWIYLIIKMLSRESISRLNLPLICIIYFWSIIFMHCFTYSHCFQVKKFLIYFRNMITEGVTYEILNLYENTFPKLTEQYFENTPWPDEDEVSPIVDNDHVNFEILLYVQYYKFYTGWNRTTYNAENSGKPCTCPIVLIFFL